MKKINIKLIFALFAFIMMQSCFNDLGNYDIKTKESVFPVRIAEIKDTVVNAKSTLTISPVLEGVDDEARYKHLWYLLPAKSGAKTPVRDTVSLEKNLSFTVPIKSGNYLLVYEVSDPKLDVYVRKEIAMTVESLFSKGWYILKDKDNKTDIDYINDRDGILNENLISSLNYPALKGEAVKLIYQNEKYTPLVTEPNGLTYKEDNAKAFYVLSKEEIRTFNADDMQLFYNFDDLFFAAPQNRHLQNGSITPPPYGGRPYIINAGQIHSVDVNGANTGKFGGPAPGVENLHSEMFTTSYAGVYVFDTVKRNFMWSGSYALTMTTLKDEQGKPSPNNMNVDMIKLFGNHGRGRNQGMAMMKNKDKDEYYLAKLKFSNDKYPFEKIDTLSSNYGITKAKTIASLSSGSSVIYFSKSEASGDALMAYLNISSEDRESELIKFEGETITYMEHIQHEPYPPTDKDFNQFVVLTNTKTGGWKLYRFNRQPGGTTIDPNPVEIYEGQGNAKHFIFRES